MKTQTEATINLVVNYSKEKGYPHTPFETIFKEHLTQGDEKILSQMIFDGMQAGAIQLTDKMQQRMKTDPKGVRRYCTGLLNDRLRKAKALNGNNKYIAKFTKEPTDELLTALKAAMQYATTTEEILEVQNAIDKRKAELAPQPKAINLDVLPEAIRKMIEG